MEENKSMTEDDGSLAFLGIPPDPNNDFYNCEAVKQRFARRAGAYRRNGIRGKRLRMKTSAWTGWCKHADCSHLVKSIL